jgi:stalled ribosome alternative rescue factor ArfA
MFKMKPIGKWKEFVALMRNYDQRVAYVRHRVGRDIALALVERVKYSAPKGSEYSVYINSLEAVELTGVKDAATFAVVSKRMTASLGEISESESGSMTVVYFTPVGEPSALAIMLSESNPWPIDMVPDGVPEKEVMIVNRVVTSGEVDFAREQAKDHVSKNESLYRRHGIEWGKKSDVDKKQAKDLMSMPDYMSLALRAEFGINADLKPHWRPAIRWVARNIKRIIEKDKKIHAALHDPLFREHTMEKNSGLPTIPGKELKEKAKSFQSKVVGG